VGSGPPHGAGALTEAARGRGDRCPYPRPFPEDFAGCPAFQPIPFLPVDSFGRPLAPGWTCRHLEIGWEAAGLAYPRCRLGSDQDRREWAARLGTRGVRLKEVRRRLVAAVRPSLEAFVEAQRAHLGDVRRRAEMDAAADRLVADLRAWVGTQAESLAQVGLDAATATAILEEMVRGWQASREPVTSLEAPPDLIARHPGAADLLAPGSD
jgi:hypothetical protein